MFLMWFLNVFKTKIVLNIDRNKSAILKVKYTVFLVKQQMKKNFSQFSINVFSFFNVTLKITDTFASKSCHLNFLMKLKVT